ASQENQQRFKYRIGLPGRAAHSSMRLFHTIDGSLRSLRDPRRFESFNQILFFDLVMSWDNLYRRYKPVTLLGYGFYKARILGIVVQHCTKLHQGGIQAAIEFDECAFRPKAVPQLFPANNFARTFQQKS